MTPEIKYLVLVSVLTALLWVPYILNRIAVRGIADTVGYPENPAPMARWATRLQSAHANAVENLVVFAALVLSANAAGVSNEATVLACIAYFWTRLAHVIAYTLALPWARTLAFAVGFVCQLTLAWQLLA
jgi:uncharacterized MAPEG superfamily protein